MDKRRARSRVSLVIFLFCFIVEVAAPLASSQDEPSGESYKENLLRTLARVVSEPSTGSHVPGSKIIEESMSDVAHIGFKNMRECCVQTFVVRSRSNGIQISKIDVVFLRRRSGSQVDWWDVVAICKNGRSDRLRCIPQDLYSSNDTPHTADSSFILPLAHEFNFSDFSRAVENGSVLATSLLHSFGFEALSGHRLDPVGGTLYCIGGFDVVFKTGEKETFEFIAEDIPVTDRPSGWQLVEAVGHETVAPAVASVDSASDTALKSAAASSEPEESDEQREITMAHPPKDSSRCTLEVIEQDLASDAGSQASEERQCLTVRMHYHRSGYHDLGHNAPFLRIVFNYCDSIVPGFDPRSNEYIFACEGSYLCREDWLHQAIDSDLKLEIEVDRFDHGTTIVIIPRRRLIQLGPIMEDRFEGGVAKYVDFAIPDERGSKKKRARWM